MIMAKTRLISMDEAMELTGGFKKRLPLSNGKEYRLIRPNEGDDYESFEDVLEDAKERLYGIRGDKCFPVHSPFTPHVVAQRKLCSKCGAEVEVETDEDLKKEYPYYCPECDENMYEFEVIMTTGQI
jgi:hypothetical protein